VHQFSTAPSQTKVLENITSSPSFETIPLEALGISSPGLAGKKISDLRPSKQSPMNSQTLGGFVPFERIVRSD